MNNVGLLFLISWAIRDLYIDIDIDIDIYMLNNYPLTTQNPS